MRLHELQPKAGKTKQRIGRGGKRGSFSGRGIKGQRSRSGHRIRPASRDLILRIPKMRGFRNKTKSEKALILNLNQLAKAKLMPLGKLDILRLKELAMVPRRYAGKIKILGTGEIDFPLAVSGLQVSGSAKAKIEKAGGKVTA